MRLVIPEVDIGEPLGDEQIAIFPLFSAVEDHLDYHCEVEAVSIEDKGELHLVNNAPKPVLLLEGDKLAPDHLLNTTILFGGLSSLRIPKRLLANGRWCWMARKSLLSLQSPEALSGGAVQDEQPWMWRHIARALVNSGFLSDEDDVTGVLERRSKRVAAAVEHLSYVDGASGLSMAAGKHALLLDLTNSHRACKRLWTPLVCGFVMDELGHQGSCQRPGKDAVRALLRTIQAAHWIPRKTLGLGQSYVAEALASALTYEGVLVHLSAVVGPKLPGR